MYWLSERLQQTTLVEIESTLLTEADTGFYYHVAIAIGYVTWKKTMQTNVEIVHFRLVSGANKEEFLAGNQDVEAWVKQQTGFISRQLCLSEDDMWSDIVQWDSGQNAKAAANQFVKDLGASAFMRMIDFSSVQMSHQTVLASC